MLHLLLLRYIILSTFSKESDGNLVFGRNSRHLKCFSISKNTITRVPINGRGKFSLEIDFEQCIGHIKDLDESIISDTAKRFTIDEKRNDSLFQTEDPGGHSVYSNTELNVE